MRKPILLLVDDDAFAAAAMAAKLAGLGEVRLAGSGTEALRMARERPPPMWRSWMPKCPA